ncbi:hypothetical protein [Inhella sp.]|uniref:hypothetical protein n=1 Tax=Inhella sp. TaxID=1921806 RepID=UPI0035B32552
MDLILENTSNPLYFTNLRWTLDAMGLRAAAFDWYVREVEANCGEAVFSAKDRWVDGLELQQVLEANEIQFFWGVFSAFPKGQRRGFDGLEGVGGPGLRWTRDPRTDPLPGAIFEIECFDSGSTLLFGISEETARNFCKVYPDARPFNSFDFKDAGHQSPAWEGLSNERWSQVEQGGQTLTLDAVQEHIQRRIAARKL